MQKIAPNDAPKSLLTLAVWMTHPANLVLIQEVPLFSQLYLFGGKTVGGVLLDDLWQFDMEAMRWAQLWPPSNPAALATAM